MACFRTAILAAAAMCIATAVQAQSFTFTGQGQVTPTGPPSPSGDLPLAVINTAYDFLGAGTWVLQSAFVFNLGSGTGGGNFSFGRGADSVSGTLTTAQALVAGATGFEISYAVTGGSGLYAGIKGSGSSLTQLQDPLTGAAPYGYLEAGIMTLVPEPGSALLMLGGLLGLASRRCSRAA